MFATLDRDRRERGFGQGQEAKETETGRKTVVTKLRKGLQQGLKHVALRSHPSQSSPGMASPSTCLRSSPSSGHRSSITDMSPSGSVSRSRGNSTSTALVQQPPSTSTGTHASSSTQLTVDPTQVVVTPSVKQSLREAVVQLVLEQVAADGYDVRTQELVKRHFSTLPTR